MTGASAVTFEIAFADEHVLRRTRLRARWLVALLESPPAEWTKVRTFRSAHSAYVRASQLRHKFLGLRFRASGCDLFAIARKGAS